MMTPLTRRFSGFSLFLAVLAFAATASAIDPPHTGDCAACHTAHGTSYPALLSQLCEGCHFPGGPALAVETHSSLSSGNGYGDWHVQCWGCHNPHKQQQDRSYGTTYGMYLHVELAADIEEIDPNDPGPYWAPLSVLRTATSSNVEHTSTTGFVDGDAESSDDICQVCHESTAYYNTGVNFNYHADYGADSQPGGDCVQCHFHDDGFVPQGGSCVSCHSQARGSPTAYRRQIVGAGGDFERASHHVTDGSATEIVTDADCVVCHDQSNHQSNVDPVVLLNDPDGGALHSYDGAGASVQDFCLGCHDADSSLAFDSDGDNSDGYQPFSDNRTPQDIATDWASASHNASVPAALGDEVCLACHGGPDSTRSGLSADPNAHGSDHGSLLSELVAGTTVANSEEELCYACHDGGIASTDLTVDFAKVIRHPVSDVDQAAVPTPGRAAECVDCHNPHGAEGPSHDYSLTATSTRNEVSLALVGASGVEPVSWPGNFETVASYSEIEAAYEYQICFKCHSSYDWGGGSPPNGLSPNGSDSNPLETDAAQEFNPANASFHPVVVGLDDASSNTSSLQNNQLTAIWSSNIGTQTMMCSDCHNSDAATPAAQGPHGSAVDFMLRGPSTVWPPTANIDGSPDLETAYNGSFCSNCHTYTRDNKAHDKHKDRGDDNNFNLYCYSCHIVVPHGGKLARLIGDRDSMPARYAYDSNPNTMWVQAFRKQTDYNRYDKEDCQAACDNDHDRDPGPQYHW